MKSLLLALFLLQSLGVVAANGMSPEGRSALADAIVCLGEPSTALDGFVVAGGTHTADYAAMGFGEGTSYRTVVVLKDPLRVAEAPARTFVSETESSNFEFSAFIYGDFEGDHAQVVKALDLKEMYGEDRESGHFQRKIANGDTCPPTIMLTPLEGGRFLMGCGWCNG